MKIKFGHYEITLLEINKVAMKVSMALAVEDGGGTRHKAGDIIAVKPEGWQWGKEEVKRYLIVEVELPGITSIEEAQKLQLPLYESGTLDPDVHDVIVGKRRFQLPLDEIEKSVALDKQKLTDKSHVYQPLQGLTLTTDGVVDKVSAKKFDTNTLK